MLHTGDRVRHKRVPEWGLGQVVETRPGYATIFFLGCGRKQFRADSPDLVPVDPGEEGHPLLDNLLSVAGPKGDRFLTPERARAKFLERYPEGFEDPAYLRDDRDPKVRACEMAAALLEREALEGLVKAGEFDEVAARARKLVGATTLVFPSEKTLLGNALKEAEGRAAFAPALFDLLYGEGEYRERFEAFAQVLKGLGAAKWTLATYFPFLRFPEAHVFVKPTITQAAAQACAFDLKYAPEPNWATYDAALRLAAYVREQFDDLKPRDLLDVQAFLRCITQRDKPAPAPRDPREQAAEADA